MPGTQGLPHRRLSLCVELAPCGKSVDFGVKGPVTQEQFPGFSVWSSVKWADNPSPPRAPLRMKGGLCAEAISRHSCDPFELRCEPVRGCGHHRGAPGGQGKVAGHHAG